MTAATLTTTATVEERRAALVELADVTDTEDRRTGKGPISPVLELIIPPLCAFPVARDVAGAVNMFNQLVGATADLHRATWLGDEVGMDRAQCDVDTWANRLVGRAA